MNVKIYWTSPIQNNWKFERMRVELYMLGDEWKFMVHCWEFFYQNVSFSYKQRKKKERKKDIENTCVFIPIFIYGFKNEKKKKVV